MRRIPLFVLPLLAITVEVEAQVLITELQPNPFGPDAAEWVELHNTGTTDAAIGGFTISDTGGTPRMYAFPAGTTIAAGQVIIVARQAAAFTAMAAANGFAVTAADYELAIGGDDPTPNLTSASGTTDFALNQTGDAVLFASDTGTFVSGAEYGTTDRIDIPGTPQTSAPAEGQTLRRIGAFGSSNIDFDVGAPTPGVGFIPAANTPPAVSNTFGAPRHMFAGDPLTVTTNAADADPITVSLYTAIATSSTGPASAMYTATTMTATTPPGYTATYSPIVVVPANFHQTYIRFYAHAADAMSSTTDPANATPDANNAAYFDRNLMPPTASPITEVRDQDANEIPLWRYHSATIEGVALTRGIAFVANRTNFFVYSPITGDAIRVFASALIPENVVEGDLVRVTGMIDVFNGHRQLGEPSVDVTILGSSPPLPPPLPRTIGQVLANGEALESQLVYIANVQLVGPLPPPNWPTNGNIDITDGVDTMVVRVTSIVSDLSNQPAPQGTFDIQGILGQFSNTGFGGYQLLPRGASDIFPASPPIDAGINDGGPGFDIGPPPLDTGVPEDDAGIDDSGMMDDDSGIGPPDNGMGPADNGVVPPDSGIVPPDTGVVPPDSGMTGDDSGPARVDAGGGGGGGGGGGNKRDEGCGCSTARNENETKSSALMMIALCLAVIARRRNRPS